MASFQRQKSAIPERLPVTLQWNDVRYVVDVKEKVPKADIEQGAEPQSPSRGCRRKKRVVPKVIIDGVSGTVKPGELLAILGPSGAGKTSLLDLLADRLRGGTITGEVMINNQQFNARDFHRVAGYVAQTERLIPMLTARETLMYAARMKLPKSVSRADMHERIELILRSLNLTLAADTRVGGEHVKGMSGGERRRLTIGIELVRFPALLFLDEPTTGLDAFTAQTVMETLLELKAQGYTLICTIHQPRHTIYQLFDKLLLLANGKSVYYGAASAAGEYFAAADLPAPPFTAIADHFLDVLTLDSRSQAKIDMCKERLARLHELYSANALAGRPGAHPTNHTATNGGLAATTASSTTRIRTTSTSSATANVLPAGERAPLSRNLAALFSRNATASRRNRGVIFVRLFISVFFALILGACYFNIGSGLAGVQDRLGLFFFIVIYSLITGFFTVDSTFTSERPIFMRERSNGTYSVAAYYTARVFNDLPYSVLYAFVFCAIAYPMIGLQSGADHFFIFFLLFLLSNFASEAYGIAFATCFATLEVASLARALVLMLLVLTGGFYSNLSNALAFLAWIKYISFVWYTFNGLAINEFRDSSLPNGNSTIIGNDVIETLNVPFTTPLIPIIVLFAMTLILRFVSYLGLLYVRPKSLE